HACSGEGEASTPPDISASRVVVELSGCIGPPPLLSPGCWAAQVSKSASQQDIPNGRSGTDGIALRNWGLARTAATRTGTRATRVACAGGAAASSGPSAVVWARRACSSACQQTRCASGPEPRVPHALRPPQRAGADEDHAGKLCKGLEHVHPLSREDLPAL